MWKHTVSKDWMMARTRYLTASSIRNILPVTETGRKRSKDQIEANMMKIVAHMSTMYISDDDCVSTGAAARGHMLEPIAIEEANLGLYHWDDVIIVKGLLGWSPDALSIPQAGDARLVKGFYDIDVFGALRPAEIGEVKSYGIEKHVAAVYTDKSKCPERWQLAVGMALLKQCQYAHLIFFNPDAHVRIAIKTYSRNDLESEIKMVLETKEAFREFVEKLPDYNSMNDCIHLNTSTKNSDYYMNQFMKAERMNV